MRRRQRPAAFASSSPRWTSKALLPLLLTALFALLSTGCGGSSNLPPVQLDTVQVEPPPAKPPLPDPEPVEMLPVEWTVLETEDGLLIGLTTRQFENLTENLAELLRWMRETRWRLDYYRE